MSLHDLACDIKKKNTIDKAIIFESAIYDILKTFPNLNFEPIFVNLVSHKYCIYFLAVV